MEFLGQISAETIKSILTEITMVLCIGCLINILYRNTYKGVALSLNFANTLTGLVIISYFVIKCVSTNMIVSLGMVGALSIVRFRNSVKDSSDIMYAFWAIAQGIIIGAQEYFLAIVFGLLMAVTVFLMFKINLKKTKKMLLIAKCNENLDLKSFNILLKRTFKNFWLKEQRVSKSGEIIVEVMSLNNQLNSDIKDLKVDGIEEISLIDYVEPMI